MTATARDRRDRLRAMLADLKMPGALEAVDGVLAQVDSGTATAGEATELVLNAQIALRNDRRLPPHPRRAFMQQRHDAPWRFSRRQFRFGQAVDYQRPVVPPMGSHGVVSSSVQRAAVENTDPQGRGGSFRRDSPYWVPHP